MATAPGIEWPLNLVDEADRDDPPEMITNHIPPIKLWTTAPLGSGSVGTVFAGMLGDQRLAVKLFGMVLPRSQQRDLDIEVRGWSALEHPRVLPFLGKCVVGIGQVALLSPYMENGNLMAYLTKYPRVERLRLLQQVAEGVHYLHTEANIVHGNLKCDNVLVSGDRTALLGDFGLSTIISKLETEDPTRTYIRIRRTAPFAAPELFRDTAMQASSDTGKMIKRSKTKSSDVYAFGMLIYEAITGAAPWKNYAADNIRARVVAGERPVRTSQFSNDLWKLCESCWAQDPSARLEIVEVLDRLTRMVSAGL